MAKAPKPFQPVIATANELASGAVVFRAASGRWSPDVAGAEIAEDEAAAGDLLARAKADEAACLVVEPALIEIERHGAFLRPTALRELIRATGPTIPLPGSASAE